MRVTKHLEATLETLPSWVLDNGYESNHVDDEENYRCNIDKNIKSKINAEPQPRL